MKRQFNKDIVGGVDTSQIAEPFLISDFIFIYQSFTA